MAWFDFRDGCISVKNPDEKILRKMHQIASQLDAKVLGVEGEEYGADGELVASRKARIQMDVGNRGGRSGRGKQVTVLVNGSRR